TQRAVMCAALVLLIARHEVAPVIAEEDKDRVLSKMFLFKHLPDTAHGGIDALAAPVVVRQLRLPITRERTQVMRNKRMRKPYHRALRPHHAIHIVLMVWL